MAWAIHNGCTPNNLKQLGAEERGEQPANEAAPTYEDPELEYDGEGINMAMLTQDDVTYETWQPIPPAPEKDWQVAGPTKRKRTWKPLFCPTGCASHCSQTRMATVTSPAGQMFYDKSAISPAEASMVMALTADDDREEALNQIAAQNELTNREGGPSSVLRSTLARS